MKPQSKKVITAAAFLVILTCLCCYFYNKALNQIYFDMWFNQILHKNELGKLLQDKDPELGFPVETKFEIDDKNSLDLKMIHASIKYQEETKTLNVALIAFNIKDGSDFRYNQLPESVSKQICGKIIYLLAENNLLSKGKEVDATKEFIDTINFYFTFDVNDMAAGEPVGGITYKRNKKSQYNFNFDFFESFDNADFS